jgi:hypothetical protein
LTCRFEKQQTELFQSQCGDWDTDACKQGRAISAPGARHGDRLRELIQGAIDDIDLNA